MEFEIAPGFRIGDGHPCFVIAEVGQNHQGNLEIAKRLITAAKEAGVHCVKFQKTELNGRFNAKALARPYTSKHSWGVTYGEHRKHLEFSEKEFEDLKKHAERADILFTASGMDEHSMDFLNRLAVPFFKVGSGDSNNLSLVKRTALYGRPIVVSTGMQDMDMVRRIYEIVTPLNSRLCLLQCTSAYPTPDDQVNLNVLKTYQKEFPSAVIGYSGHEKGLEVTLAAVALGAKVVERHLTLDHSWKGSDHQSSLQPEELEQLVKGIRRVEMSLGSSVKNRQESEKTCYRKLGKSVVARKALAEGTVLRDIDVVLKVAEPPGCPGEKLDSLVGRVLLRDIGEDESITANDFAIEKAVESFF